MLLFLDVQRRDTDLDEVERRGDKRGTGSSISEIKPKSLSYRVRVVLTVPCTLPLVKLAIFSFSIFYFNGKEQTLLHCRMMTFLAVAHIDLTQRTIFTGANITHPRPTKEITAETTNLCPKISKQDRGLDLISKVERTGALFSIVCDHS